MVGLRSRDSLHCTTLSTVSTIENENNPWICCDRESDIGDECRETNLYDYFIIFAKGDMSCRIQDHLHVVPINSYMNGGCLSSD